MESEIQRNAWENLETVENGAWARTWRMLYNLSTMLAVRNLDLDRILSYCLESMMELTHAQRGVLFLYDETGQLTVRLSRQIQEAFSPEMEIARAVVRKVLDDQEILFWQGDDLGQRLTGIADQPKPAFLIAMPLQMKVRAGQGAERRRFSSPHRLLGVLYLDSLDNGILPDRQMIALLPIFSAYTASILMAAQFYSRATTDPLTGFLMPHQFELSLKDEEEVFQKTHDPFSVILLDIDQFRRINEDFGYQFGEEVLFRVSSLLRSNLRYSDVCGRLGGDKFAFLLLGAKAEDATAIAQKLLQAISHDGLLAAHRITASVGIACHPLHSERSAQLITLSDQALYKAKQKGPGTIELWNETLAQRAAQTNKLAGILSGNYANDYRNVLFLLEAIRAVNTVRDHQQLFTRIVDLMIQITGTQRGALFLHEATSPPKIVAALVKSNPSQEAHFDLAIPQEVARSGVIYYREDRGLVTLCVPLKDRGKYLGSIYVDNQGPPTQRSAGEINVVFCSALAKELSIAIQNAQLYADYKQKCLELQKVLEEKK